MSFETVLQVDGPQSVGDRIVGNVRRSLNINQVLAVSRYIELWPFHPRARYAWTLNGVGRKPFEAGIVTGQGGRA